MMRFSTYNRIPLCLMQLATFIYRHAGLCFDVDVAGLLYWQLIGRFSLWRRTILQFVGVPAI